MRRWMDGWDCIERFLCATMGSLLEGDNEVGLLQFIVILALCELFFLCDNKPLM